MSANYEYIRVPFTLADVSQINKMAAEGWRLVSAFANPNDVHLATALMEREKKLN